MTTPTDPTRVPAGPPTVAEIAALTARLRDLSARGWDVDPAERTAFLADRDALMARISNGPDETGPAGKCPDATGDVIEHAHLLTGEARQPRCRQIDPDADRRAQLAAWHADDRTGTDSMTGRDHDPVIERSW